MKVTKAQMRKFRHAIWLEDESQRIGLINFPPDLLAKMREATLYFIDIPFEERLEHVVELLWFAGQGEND